MICIALNKASKNTNTMPVLNITLNTDAYSALQDEYKKMAVAWPRPGRTSPPPSFEEWLGTRVTDSAPAAKAITEDVRTFATLEKLITQLAGHGFALAHIGKNDVSAAHAARELSARLVNDLNLPHALSKRIEELIGYYAKSGKEIADLAHVGVTNRTYGALHEACRDLLERTENAIDRLGEERAIGRAEGAIAMLVSLGVMDRAGGKEKTEMFKEQARNPGKRIA